MEYLQDASKNPVPLSSRLLVIMTKANLSENPRRIITSPDSMFMKHGANKEDIKQIKWYFTRNAVLRFKSVFDLPDEKCITFGCKALDELTTGGIICGKITEINGEAGTGKTQIALQLALNTQLPLNHGGVAKKIVFICTESRFPSTRLEQMIVEMNRKYSRITKCQIKFSQNILVQHILEPENLMGCVCSILPRLLAQQEIGLIIIDSIAGVFRNEDDYLKRSDNLRDFAQVLSSLATRYNCAVLILNQVTSVIDDENEDAKETFVPCLGLAWSNLINVRFQIFKTKEIVQISEFNEQYLTAHVRELQVIFSGYLEDNSAKFVISKSGLIDVPS